jgi:hypothetical protein
MFQKIMGFLQHHGFQVMMTGFVIIAVCALYYTICIMGHHLTHSLKNAIFSVAFGGLIVYALGRVLVFLENKKQKAESVNSSKGPV